jgi:hypothetical protein
MRKKQIARSLAVVTLSMAATLAPAWAQSSSNPAQNSQSERTLTGIVSDSSCKGQHFQKAQTQFSCTLKCVHEEGRDYVLVVGQ